MPGLYLKPSNAVLIVNPVFSPHSNVVAVLGEPCPERIILCLPVCTDVYLPARVYIGKFGAVFATYFASAMLHVSINMPLF